MNEQAKQNPCGSELQSIEEVVRIILRDCPYWAPEFRVHKLLPYLRVYGDPLYDALMLLSEDERKCCGVDQIVVKKIGA